MFLPSHPQANPFIEMAPHSFQLPLESFFKKSIFVPQRLLIRPEFFLPGDEAVVPKDSLALLPWHIRVTLDVEVISVLKHPRQREMLRILREKMI